MKMSRYVGDKGTIIDRRKAKLEPSVELAFRKMEWDQKDRAYKDFRENREAWTSAYAREGARPGADYGAQREEAQRKTDKLFEKHGREYLIKNKNRDRQNMPMRDTASTARKISKSTPDAKVGPASRVSQTGKATKKKQIVKASAMKARKRP
jgi:hypothetical protein